MDKISEEKIAAVLTEIPGALRALDADRNAWKERAKTAEARLSSIDQAARIQKAAEALEKKGYDSRPLDQRIKLLEKKAAEGKLDLIEEALELRPNEIALGEVSSDIPGQGLSDLESFILEG